MTGTVTDLVGLTERLSLPVLNIVAPELEPRVGKLQDFTGVPFEALKSFLQGEAAYDRDEWTLAEQRYEAAIEPTPPLRWHAGGWPTSGTGSAARTTISRTCASWTTPRGSPSADRPRGRDRVPRARRRPPAPAARLGGVARTARRLPAVPLRARALPPRAAGRTGHRARRSRHARDDRARLLLRRPLQPHLRRGPSRREERARSAHARSPASHRGQVMAGRPRQGAAHEAGL